VTLLEGASTGGVAFSAASSSPKSQVVVFLVVGEFVNATPNVPRPTPRELLVRHGLIHA
jgi:hypothetical protein